MEMRHAITLGTSAGLLAIGGFWFEGEGTLPGVGYLVGNGAMVLAAACGLYIILQLFAKHESGIGTHRQLSTSLTPLSKFVFPVFWIGMMGLMMFNMWVQPDLVVEDPKIQEVRPVFTVFAMLTTGFVLWTSTGIKDVRLVGRDLRVSNYFQTTLVPLGDVERVSGSVLIYPELVWIHLRRTSNFGRKIKFHPKWRFFAGYSVHPVVKELNDLIREDMSDRFVQPNKSQHEAGG